MTPPHWKRSESGLDLLDRLFGGVGLCRVSHGSGVTVRGVIGGSLQPPGGGNSLRHGVFGDLLIFFPGFLILRLGSESVISITPALCGGHERFVLLLRKVPNYDIQIGVRHCLFPQLPSEFHIIDYAIAEAALQIMRPANAPFSPSRLYGRPGQRQARGSARIVLNAMKAVLARPPMMQRLSLCRR
jgi:hypothetical protein